MRLGFFLIAIGTYAVALLGGMGFGYITTGQPIIMERLVTGLIIFGCLILVGILELLK